MVDLREPMRALGAPQEAYAYWGDRPQWLVLAAVTRDSDVLERSNFRVLREDMSEQYGEAVAIERMNHWLCGWIDYLIVDASNAGAVASANAWRARLADYPVADEYDFSDLEIAEQTENMEIAAHDADRIGHSAPPEIWDAQDDYMCYTCSRCGADIRVSAYTWDVPARCIEDDED